MEICFRTLDNRAKPINLIHDDLLNKKISTNRAKLLSVAKTVLLCGRQNIPLRGHRDDSAHYNSHDCGNLQSLLDFRVDSGDTVLEEHFKTARAMQLTGQTYTSSTSVMLC